MADNKKTGTGFTNLSRVLQANQGNRLGSTIASNIQGQAQKAKEQIGSGIQGFQSEAEKNRLDTEANKQFVGGTIQNIQNPNSISSGDKERFAKIRQGIYQGPTQIQNMQNIRGTAQQAQQLGNLTTSGSGRQELLKQTVGSPNYSYGQRRVDSMLLAQQPNQLSNVRRSTQGLLQQADLADAQSRAYAQELQGRAKQFGQDVQTQVGGAMTGIDEQVQAQYKAAQDAEAQRQDVLKNLEKNIMGERVQTGVDANGNPIYGATHQISDPFARMDYIRGKLSPVASEAQLRSLFGEGNISDQKKALDIKNAQDRDRIQREAFNKLKSTNMISDDYNTALSRGIINDISRHDLGAIKRAYSTNLTNKPIEDAFKAYDTISPTTQRNIQDYNKISGLAGRAAQEGHQGTFYKNLLDSIMSKSQASGPQNLTEQGVANEQQRARFQALNELLGKSASDAKYRIDDPNKYEAGTIGLDAEQIRRTLGY